MDLQQLIKRSTSSAFYKHMLNWALNRMIPFNKPHQFSVVEINANKIKVRLPFIKRNLNHIKGIHACAMATVSEFATGFLLVSRLDPKKFRIIMQRLEMDYHYQGKMDAYAVFEITDEWLQRNVYDVLTQRDATVIVCEILIHDRNNNHLSTGKVHWQIKDWQKVKTK